MVVGDDDLSDDGIIGTKGRDENSVRVFVVSAVALRGKTPSLSQLRKQCCNPAHDRSGCLDVVYRHVPDGRKVLPLVGPEPNWR